MSISGRSRPSLKRSAANSAFTSRRRSLSRAAARSSSRVWPETASAGMPASRKTRAMYSACATLTQKPSARIVPTSVTLCRSSARTLRARPSLPV